MIKLTTLFFLVFIASVRPVHAQQQPFYDEIQQFKKEDSISPPPANAIVFTGSSSFRKWTDVQSYFPGYKIINRGFGGSTFPDVINYAGEVVLRYRPKQVVIYCGDNDLASSDTVTPKMVAYRFKILFNRIRSKLPKTNIAYVSIKPSPSREQLMAKMQETNRLIRSFLQQQKGTSFIDVYNLMLQPNGQPMTDIFLEDHLHMNQKGYKIWQKAMKPYLLK